MIKRVRSFHLGLIATAIAGMLVGCGAPAPKPVDRDVSIETSDEDIKWMTEILEKRAGTGQNRHTFVGDIAVPIANQLGKVGPRSAAALPALEKLSSDKDPYVRDAAVKAIAKIKNEPQP
jgi:HEAT repeat protein